MGRRRTTPELQKLKAFDDSPELTGGTKAASSQKIKEPTKSMSSPRIVTRARGRRALKKDDPIDVPEMNETTIIVENEAPVIIEDEGIMSPKRFYSKKIKRSAKSTESSTEQNEVPAVKKSRRTVKDSGRKSGSKNCPEPNSDDSNVFPVFLQKKSYSKTKQQSRVTEKNIQNKISTSNPPTVLKKENRVREPRVKNKAHMTTEEVLTELTSDKTTNLLPPTKKADAVNLKRIRKDADDTVSVKRSRTVKPADNVGSKKRKVHLSLEDIVNEISPDRPKKKTPESKAISDISQSAVSLQKDSTTKQKAVKKGRPKKVSDNANGLDDEWDHSLLLITDDLNDSGNVYDFEEFQIGAVKSSSANNSSLRKSDKKKSIKTAAAMKAVLSKRKVNKELSSQRKPKKSTTKTSKTTSTKKITQKKVSPPPPTSGNPTIGSTISVENPNSSVENCGISVSDDPFQTPSIQMMREPMSITELEKVKFTKLIENKVISKVNPGPQAVLAPGWPQLPALPSQQFTKLKRGAMEGPTAADNLPENKPRSIMIKTSSAFNQSTLDLSSINADPPENPPSKRVEGMLTEKLSTDNQPIDLFTYPLAIPIKKKSDGVKKSGKCIEIKETPVKKLMDFMYAGSVERYLKKPKDPNLMSPPAVMLPKFLRAETSTPNTMVNGPKSLGGESMHISPVKDFQSPASMRTYDHISRRSSASFLAIIKNGDLFNDEPKENSPQPKKVEKTKTKKKDSKKNKKFDEWANQMSNEFDEIEHFELSIDS